MKTTMVKTFVILTAENGEKSEQFSDEDWVQKLDLEIGDALTLTNEEGQQLFWRVAGLRSIYTEYGPPANEITLQLIKVVPTFH